MSPDLRQQLLRHRSFKVDGVIFTHEHYDHTSGINELRPVFFGSGRTLKIYSNAECIESIKSMFFYLFEDGVQEHNIHDPSNRVDEIDYAKEFSGNALYGSGDLTGNDRSANLYMPYISANIIADRFQIGDISGICFEQNHGHSKSMGIRVGNFAYTTDVVAFPEESFAKLYGLDVWVVDCLSPEVVSNHANIDSVLQWVEILKPKMTYLTHMSIRMDYDRLLQILPPNVRPAYDQMQFEVNNQ
jgi:phosphoribosyl 1,2-cyclic phosphate phosphodiesterase